MCDKEFNGTANYALGHVEQFMQWIANHHSGGLLMPIVQSLGGKRQDRSFEGALPVFMDRRYFVAFLHHYICCTYSNNILQHKFFTTLSCVEVIAEIRFASIFFIVFVVPMRWLAGNTQNLAH